MVPSLLAIRSDAVLPTDGSDLKEAVEAVTDGRGADLTIETDGRKVKAVAHEILDKL